MKPQIYKKNIYLMYAICFFQGIVLYASISTLYRQARGLSLAEYAVIDGFSYIFQLAFEIPLGMVADRIGYKKTLVLANFAYLVSKVIFWQAFGFTSFLMERLFLSIALAGLSGLDSSILYLSCGKQDSQKIFSHYGAFGTAGMLTGCMIFTAFLYNNYEATAFGTVITYGIAFLLSFFVQDVKDTEPKEARPTGNHLLEILKITLKDRLFFLFILGDTLLAYGVWAVNVFLNQGRYMSLGLTEQHIGIITLGFSALALTGAWSARLTKRIGFRPFMVLGMLAVATGAFVMGTTGSPLLAIASGATVEIAYALLVPLIRQLYSQRVSVSDRATQLSIYSMIAECLNIGLSFLMSLIAALGDTAPFLFCTAICLIGIVLFRICYRDVSSIED